MPTTAKPQVAKVPYSLAGLALYFLKLGTFGFGGPIALAAYMERDLVERRGWVTREDYMEGLALAQLSPGPLAAQLAIYLGYIRNGFLGATAVAAAFVGPSFLIVLAIAMAYVRYGGLPWMQAAFYGIGAAVIGIITSSAWKLVRMSLGKDRLLWGVFFVLAISTAITERESVWFFLAGGVVSLLVKAFPEHIGMPSRPAAIAFTLGTVSLGKFGEVLAFFTKAGLFVFGSGLAIVPFLHGGVVVEHHWLTERQFVDAVAVAMITPGPVVITVAFIGYLVAGFSGAVAAAIGVFLPVFLVVLALAPHFRRLSRNPQLKAFIRGVTAAAVGAIAGSVVVLGRRSIHDSTSALVAVITLILLLRWKIPEPVLIVAAGIAGLALYRG